MSYEIKDSGTRQEFSTGAVRDAQIGKGRYDMVPMATLAALAQHYEKGCLKYGENNWQKGIPVMRFLDSAMRHLSKAMAGMNDENHMISALWNIFSGYETLLRTQLGDLPAEINNSQIILPDPWDRVGAIDRSIEVEDLPF